MFKQLGCCFSVALLLSLLPARADAPAYKKTAHGLDFKIGEARVELAPATPTAFRLSISYDGPATALATTFLDPSVHAADVAWTVARSGNSVGIKTAAGELLIDPSAARWTLLDAGGKTLVPPTGLGSVKGDAIELPVDEAGAGPLVLYGCGNGQVSLQQAAVPSHVSNGRAVIPHAWSPAGYAVLAVSGDDNRPATALPSPDRKSLLWTFPGRHADLYLMPAATLGDEARTLDDLTGRPPVPPRWAFGYLQSRWGWKDRAYIEDTLHQFLTRHIPVDAFIYDFEWYTPHPDYELGPAGGAGFPDFGWNPQTFPDPAAQVDAYRAQGLHFIGIRKPRIGNADSLKMLRAKGWILGSTSAEPNDKQNIYHSRDMAFYQPGFRHWYAAQSQPLLQKNIYGWWNDEGEGTFTSYFYWNQAELDAFHQAKPGRRLWTINRAFSPGVQRLGAACWTGDIQANWRILSDTPTELLNWSLAGMTYGACDIGGYSPETQPDLLARWMEAGVFFPVYRAHSEIGRTPHFPWLFGPEAEAAITKAIDLRYRLIPYYYSLAHEAHDNGTPLMRPLLMEYPDDPQLSNLSSEWLMGDGLLAAPILTPDGQRSVYLPHDDWFQFGTTTKLTGGQTLNLTAKLDEIPIYVRAGTILPLGNVVQNTDALPGGPLEVQVYPGRDASFSFVEDDGETTAYLKGAMRKTIFMWNDQARRLSWKSTGPYSGPRDFHDLKVVLFDPAQAQPSSATGSLDAAGAITLP